MSAESKAQQYLIGRNFHGEKHWFNEVEIYYEIPPNVMQDYADQEVNEVLLKIKYAIKTMDTLSKAELKALINSFLRNE